MTITWTRSARANTSAQADGTLDWDWRNMSGDEPSRWLWNTGNSLDGETLDALFDVAARASSEKAR
jgi:hypothetical protein